MDSSDTTQYIYVPLALMLNLSKPSQITCGPVVAHFLEVPCP